MGNQGAMGTGGYGEEHLPDLEKNLVKFGEIWEKTGSDAMEARMKSCKNLIDLIKGINKDAEKNPGMQ